VAAHPPRALLDYDRRLRSSGPGGAGPSQNSTGGSSGVTQLLESGIWTDLARVQLGLQDGLEQVDAYDAVGVHFEDGVGFLTPRKVGVPPIWSVVSRMAPSQAWMARA
jgi:hypothetical protein